MASHQSARASGSKKNSIIKASKALLSALKSKGTQTTKAVKSMAASASKAKGKTVAAKNAKPAPQKAQPAKAASKPMAKATKMKAAPAKEIKAAAKPAAKGKVAAAPAKPVAAAPKGKTAAAGKEPVAAPAAKSTTKAAPAAPVKTAMTTKGKGKGSAIDKNSAAYAAAAAVEKVTGRLVGRMKFDPSTDAVCREVACEGLGTTAGYCRLHYIKNWRKIKRKEVILRERKLNTYIEELVAKYPEKYIEAIRQDLMNDKDFAKVIHDLDLDENIDEFEGEGGDSDVVIDSIKREFEDDSDAF